MKDDFLVKIGGGALGAYTRANLRSLINFSASAGELIKRPANVEQIYILNIASIFNKVSRSRVRICGYATKKAYLLERKI